MISERGATRLRGRSFWRTSAASGAAYFCLLGLAAVASTGEARSPEPRGLYRSRFTPANRCVAIESVATRSFVRVDRSGAYRADRPRRSGATGFFAKPTGLGTYMLHDPDRRLVIVTSEGRVGRADFPGPPAGWALRRLAKRGFSIRSTATRRQLAVWADGRLVLADGRARGRSRAFRLFRQRGCRRYPEAAVGVSGRPFKGTARDGELFGFVDAHLHITADMRAGGRVISGEAFDRFGITEPLGRDY